MATLSLTGISVPAASLPFNLQNFTQGSEAREKGRGWGCRRALGTFWSFKHHLRPRKVVLRYLEKEEVLRNEVAPDVRNLLVGLLYPAIEINTNLTSFQQDCSNIYQ